MVNNTGTLMSMRLVRSKLRKREDTSAETTAGGLPIETITTNGGLIDVRRSSSFTNGHIVCGNGNGGIAGHEQQISPTERRVEFNITTTDRSEREITFIRTSGVGSVVAPQPNNTLQANSWVFPPKAPSPHIYNCMNDVLLANEKNGFKGFRKQFSGRFKRLVSKKPAEPAPAIPPELKPQLKTIYVY